ncbi:MAG: LysM peptidoglycan-binding domain-containing protein [Anaerolineales bacterium]|nr:LysM peptidoglycan-binding domain-containing protein [Anaerolineales bacterium]
MPKRTCLRLFVACLAAALVAGCTMPAPNLPPTVSFVGTPEPPSATPGPTLLPGVAETATALALGTLGAPTDPTAGAFSSPSPDLTTAAPANVTATPSPLGPGETPGPVQTATPLLLDDGTPDLPPGCQAMRTVQPGEWLQLIADDYGLTWQALADANGLADPENLTAGQVLCIPIPGVTVTPPNASGGGTPSGSGGGSATLTPAPGDGLAILAFDAGPTPVQRGNVVRLTWTVRAAAGVSLYRMDHDWKTDRWNRQAAPAYTGAGSGNLTLPVALDAREALRFELVASDAASHTVSVQTDPLPLLCYIPFYASAPEVNSCRSEPKTVPGEFQAFEYGYMLWRSDTGEVYVLPQRPDQFLAWTIQLPEGDPVEVGPAPQADLYAPGLHFSTVWATLDTQPMGGSGLLREALGWATTPAQSYSLTLQPRLDTRYSMFDVVFVSFPDDRIAMLTTGGGLPTPGLFGPAWSFVEN